MRTHEYSERAMHIARGMICRTGTDRALDVDAIVWLANATIIARMLDMRPAQLRDMADSIEADVMREPINAMHAEDIRTKPDVHTQIVALRAAANVRKRKRAPYFKAFMEA
jgi:hypothetical protein